MLNRQSPRVINFLLAIVVASSLSMAPTGAVQQPPTAGACVEPIPTGFRPLDQFSWDGPWAFAPGGTTPVALAALDNAYGQLTNGPMPIQLDDGSEGTLRVESRECTTSEDCAPFDCGCTGLGESYWIDVADVRGRSVAHLHLWAAYNRLQIVPVDLIDGPGDELVIVRIPNHASPPIGYDLKIWKIGATKPIELGDIDRVAGRLGSNFVGCAQWRTFVSIDPKEAKPRSIALRNEFGTAPCCRLADGQEERIANMRRGQVLRFDPERRKYVPR